MNEEQEEYFDEKISDYNTEIRILNNQIKDRLGCSAILFGFSTFAIMFYKELSLDYMPMLISSSIGALAIGGGVCFALDSIKKISEKASLESVVKRLEFERGYNKIEADTPVVYTKKIN